jgi:hypothetical protein
VIYSWLWLINYLDSGSDSIYDTATPVVFKTIGSNNVDQRSLGEISGPWNKGGWTVKPFSAGTLGMREKEICVIDYN